MAKTDGFDPVIALVSGAGILLAFLITGGCVGGYLLGERYGTGEFARWEPWPTPPTKAVEIVAGDPWVVYVRTEDGNVFACRPDRSRIDQVGACVEEEPTAEHLADATTPCDPPLGFAVSTPVGDVLDRIDTYNCHFEVGMQSNYALLEDGSLWSWSWSVSALGTAALMITSLIGGAISGAVLGVVVVLGIVGAMYMWGRLQRSRS